MNIKGVECFSEFLGSDHTRERSNCQVSSKYDWVAHTHLDWFISLGCGLLSFSSCFMVHGIGAVLPAK